MDKDIINQLLLVMIPVLSAAAAFVISCLRAKTRELNRGWRRMKSSTILSFGRNSVEGSKDNKIVTSL